MASILKMRCRKCLKVLKVPSSSAGKKTKCPACKTTMLVPSTFENLRQTDPRAVIEESELATPPGVETPIQHAQETFCKINCRVSII